MTASLTDDQAMRLALQEAGMFAPVAPLLAGLPLRARRAVEEREVGVGGVQRQGELARPIGAHVRVVRDHLHLQAESSARRRDASTPDTPSIMQ